MGNFKRRRSLVMLAAAAALVASSLVACKGSGDGPQFSSAHPRIYIGNNAERLRGLLADERPAATHFKYLVDLQIEGQDLYDFRAWHVALMGQLTGEPRYCEFAVAQITAYVDSEYARIENGEAPYLARDSYLEVGIHVGDIALTYDWCYPQVSGAQRERWLALADQAVWNVWNHEDATWGGQSMPWSGWSVTNPANNYYYSFIRATMMLGIAANGELPRASEWLEKFREEKIAGEVISKFESEMPGGGSLEGTGYGVAMYRLFELYDWWEDSSGENLGELTGHTRASMLAMMHAIVPTLDRIAPIGDHARDATASLFDYHRSYLLILSYMFADEPIAAHARALLAASSVPEMTQHSLAVYDFIYDLPDLTPRPLVPSEGNAGLGLSYVAEGTGQIYARSSWEPDATWLSLIAGTYNESHAHRDQGSLMLFKRQWLAYDSNIQSTSGISQEEALHNLVRLSNGEGDIRQREGTTSQVRAVAQGEGWFYVSVDVTDAYDGHADVTAVRRALVFLAPNTVVVFDHVNTAAGTTQVWQINSPLEPALSGSQATFAGDDATLVVRRIEPGAPTPSTHAWNGEFDVAGGYRYDQTTSGGDRRYLHVMSLDGDVASTSQEPGSDHLGVIIGFADGREATVRFAADGLGGTLNYSGPGGTIYNGALPTTVAALPE